MLSYSERGKDNISRGLWGNEVAYGLSGIIDLVKEGTLYHLEQSVTKSDVLTNIDNMNIYIV